MDNIDLGGNTPLHLATERNMKDAVIKLMGHGGDAELPNQMGFSCLHIAAREGHTDLVKIFKAKDVNLDQRDEFGYSPSYWAHQNKHLDVCAILPPPLKRTKEEFYEHIMNVWDKHGYTPGDKKGKKGKKKGGKKKK